MIQKVIGCLRLTALCQIGWGSDDEATLFADLSSDERRTRKLPEPGRNDVESKFFSIREQEMVSANFRMNN